MRRLLCCMLIYSAFWQGSEAGVKYVAPGGDAAWPDCTAADKPCSKTTAANRAVAGDLVVFLPGRYQGGLRIRNGGTCQSASDDDTRKIVFQAADSDAVVLDGSLPADRKINILIAGNCIAIRNFVVKVPDIAGSTVAILNLGRDNEIAYNHIAYDGNLVPTSGFAHADGIVLRNRAWVHENRIHSVTVGVSLVGHGTGAGHRSVVEGNVVFDVNKGDLEDADCFKAVKNTTNGDFFGAIIRGNECYGWHDDGFDGLDTRNLEVSDNFFHDPDPFADHPTCIKPGYYSVNQTIIGNRCLGLPRKGGQRYCIDAQGTQSSIFEGNYCDGGTYGIYLQRGAGRGNNNRFIRNTIINAFEAAFFLAQGGVKGTILRDNTFSGTVRDMLITSGGTVTGSGNRFLNDKNNKGFGKYLGGQNDSKGPL